MAIADPTGQPLTLQQVNALRGASSELLSLEGESIQDQAASQGDLLKAEGTAAEGTAYGTAAEIAAENARQEETAGRLTEYQQGRTAFQTIGKQRADVAGAGFGDSGSALYLMRDSLAQYHVGQQITGTQTAISEGGYQEQRNAALGEQAAANLSSQAATTAAAAEAAAGQSAATARTNFAAVLSSIPQGQAALDIGNGLTDTGAVKDLEGVNTAAASTAGTRSFNGVSWVTTPAAPAVGPSAPTGGTAAAVPRSFNGISWVGG